jgi:transcriptional regulator with XRE-family HTH domain
MMSRMDGESVISIISRSMPMPQPPVGGMSYSSTRMKSALFISERPLAYSRPVRSSSKRSVRLGWSPACGPAEKRETVSHYVQSGSVEYNAIHMPAKAPPVPPAVTTQLETLGRRIRAQREQQKVTATDAAEAAGMSRMTLHRVEQGEPSVTMGAYLSALAAVGLSLQVREPDVAFASALPAVVRLDDYPALKQIAWQLPGVAELNPSQALDLYERNWRHLDRDNLTSRERKLIQALADELGAGRLLV